MAPLRQRPRGEEDSSGFTLIEVAVTCLVMMIVLGALLGVLESGTKVEARTQAMISSQEDVRFTMAEVLRDLRAADPLLPMPSLASYYASFEVRHGTTASPVYLRWSIDPVTSTMLRHVLSGAGGVPVATSYRLERVRNADLDAPVTTFRYFNSEGTELTAANATPADFANCTIRVRVTIKADTDPSPGLQPFSLTSDAELRNRLPGGVGC